MLNGFDEAIVLTADGHVSEGSAENLFMVRDGVLITPSVSDDILEGITRAGIIEIAEHLDIPVKERQIDRSELYIADEVFLCGTGRAGLAGRVGRSPAGRRRPRRADHAADQQDLLRRGARSPAGIPPLGHAGLQSE